MSTIRLDTLPKELISQIAVSSDALSILSLSQTCRKIRSACYDSLVFRELLQTQRNLWTLDSLDLDTIDTRCGRDASLWARFALADQKAFELSQRECPLETPERFLDWLPELFIVKHPFMYQQCWARFLWDPYQLTTKQMFCFVMAILARKDDPMQQLEKSLVMHEDNFIRQDESSKAYLWGLCFMIIKVRKLLRTRGAIWPYNHAAVVPYIQLPNAEEVNMRPTNSSYQLPLPFADRCGNSPTWDDWYLTHSREMGKSYLFEGTWHGYYTYFGSSFSAIDQLDPPMVSIQFGRRQSNPSDGDFEIVAEDCRDGIGPFSIVGDISHVDDVFTFCGYKAYGSGTDMGMGAGVSWNWKLKLAPFGLVGYWGLAREDGGIDRNGCVWLWKAPN